MNRTISTSANVPRWPKGVPTDEDDLDVENDEQHGGQIELDGEWAAPGGCGAGFDAALIGLGFGAVVPARTDHERNADRSERERRCDHAEDQDGQVRIHAPRRAVDELHHSLAILSVSLSYFHVGIGISVTTPRSDAKSQGIA